jgi:hypothetical protein
VEDHQVAGCNRCGLVAGLLRQIYKTVGNLLTPILVPTEWRPFQRPIRSLNPVRTYAQWLIKFPGACEASLHLLPNSICGSFLGAWMLYGGLHFVHISPNLRANKWAATVRLRPDYRYGTF